VKTLLAYLVGGISILLVAYLAIVTLVIPILDANPAGVSALKAICGC
jgi:hypothetical protein